MPHIHTKPGQHDSTVSAFIIRYNEGQPLAMLIMHRKLDVLLQPGGHIELDETPWQAMAHELEEETGYTLSEMKVWQPKTRLSLTSASTVTHPQPFLVNTHSIPGNHAHTDLGYVLISEELPFSAPDEGESTDIRWINREQLVALPESEIKSDTKEIYRFIFDKLLTDDTWESVPANIFSLASPDAMEE